MSEKPRILACRGEAELLVERSESGVLSFLSDLEIYGKFSASAKPVTAELKAGASEDGNAHRLEMIQQLRSGTHLEIVVKRALAFRQPKGKPNRNYLRFADDALAGAAPSWKSQPFLVDHNHYEQAARKGTILTSELAEDAKGTPAYFMGFSVVKTDAAISVLDGTIDRFSIGWFPTCPVFCTAHGVDIRSSDSCGCWPGDKVMVDGKQKIAEYEYQAGFTGKELSAVNVPAVIGTRIEEYHQALAAELDLPPTRNIPREPKTMLSKLAAALALTTLTEADEDRAVAGVTALRERATSAELSAATLQRDVTRLTGELAIAQAAVTAASAQALDGVIAEAYAAGKLAHGKDAEGKNTPDPLEDLLRAHGKAAGRDSLIAKVKAMKVVVPIGVPPIALAAGDPPKTTGADAWRPTDAELAANAEQMGVPLNDLRANWGLAPIGATP